MELRRILMQPVALARQELVLVVFDARLVNENIEKRLPKPRCQSSGHGELVRRRIDVPVNM